VAAASAAALPAYYRTPKQSYRALLTHLESVRSPSDLVVVAHYAEGGCRYYSRRLGLDTARFRYARTADQFNAVLAEEPQARVWVLSTFSRAFRVDEPDFERRLQEGWVVERRFPATIGDGQTTIWRQR